MPWLKGVSTTMGMVGLSCLMERVKYVVALGCGHTDHEVDVHVSHLFLGFGFGVHLDESWRKAQSQARVFREYLLVHSSVILEHERVVGVGQQQYVVHAPQHQIHKRGIFQCHVISFSKGKVTNKRAKHKTKDKVFCFVLPSGSN